MDHTQQLTLRKIGAEQLEAVADLLRHDAVKKTYMVPDLTREAAQKLACRLSDLSREEGRYVRGVYLDSALIGFINDTEITGNSIELGWVIHPDRQNCGYATKAVTAAIKELFDRGFDEVIAGAFSENPASIRVMEKVGMTRLDKEEVISYRGKDHRCVFYSIRRSGQ